MDFIKSLLNGISSIANPSFELPDVIAEYPSTYIKDDKEAIKNIWDSVGGYLKGAINEYEKESKQKFTKK